MSGGGGGRRRARRRAVAAGQRRPAHEGAGRQQAGAVRQHALPAASRSRPGQFTANLTKDQSLDAAKKAIYKAIAGIISEPPTKEEVERIKTGMLRSHRKTCLTRNAGDCHTDSTTPISQGDWRLMFLQHDRIKNVTPEDLVRVAKTYFKASNRTVGYYIPDAAPDRTVVPDTPDLEKSADRL